MDLKETKAKDKPSISIEQSIANSFHLRNCAFNDVIVRKVNKSDVVLDSVELVFKDQYLARSDMWRIKNNMMKTCVYLNKTITFNGQRAQVFEMWSQGERVACGYVGEETKVVWRSASSMVYLFIQMSSEMWDYDINGDLYFEKAINGLLYDLFAKWKVSSLVLAILLLTTRYSLSNSLKNRPRLFSVSTALTMLQSYSFLGHSTKQKVRMNSLLRCDHVSNKIIKVAFSKTSTELQFKTIESMIGNLFSFC